MTDDPLLRAAVALLLAYLLGALSGSLLFGRLRGVDIRTEGSGNAGGTNALRTRGWRFALPVVLFDVGKGTLAAWLAWLLHRPGAGLTAEALALAATLLAAIGHAWPVWFGFRGGKGVATLLGGLLLVWPASILPLLALWLLLLGTTGYVGLASVCAALALTPLALWRGSATALLFALAAGAFVAWTHRGNLQRLHAGTEHRFRRARLLLPRAWR